MRGVERQDKQLKAPRLSRDKFSDDTRSSSEIVAALSARKPSNPSKPSTTPPGAAGAGAGAAMITP